MKKALIALIPLAVFFSLIALLYINMGNHSEVLPSPLIGKPVPEFEHQTLYSKETLTQADFIGEPWLLNVFGSWCPSCQVEHPLVAALANTGKIKVVGLNWKDEEQDAKAWLQKWGDPYHEVLVDYEGDTAINLGVYGAPETFLIDAQGIIRYKIAGVLTSQIIRDELLPLIEEVSL
ncbi:DsbE family thiol:disulfide interchange protein [Marinicella sp. S1101]|uniref:DsbE family thiol:disulfide interchange protein n=1 Tax=Marinicella marina TaxID=2996016 RepID=UPI002260B261|nr:DsbE family thiol:disulfide interchange protein [Marinicella marina]MCX7554511.1 DsbE family thiol:disulfide interchange protein [Marinicella marina]MDJ1140662.1 DsbE family thiol:disulfide interchange protein [Marinicella marina]